MNDKYEIRNYVKGYTENLLESVKSKTDDYRTAFQHDRDRIIHSKEFRRLSGKTQIFVSGFGDNMRTRLTHTLEVSQIAKTIAKYFGFDEDLTEAIALGHDVGHTPFGHAGERALNYIMNGCFDCYGYNRDLDKDKRGFKHNLQSYRVLTELERVSKKHKGLNLSEYALWGIQNHTGVSYKDCGYMNEDKCMYKGEERDCKGRFETGFYDNTLLDESKCWTFEASIVFAADEIAQRHHDIEDGLFANIINSDSLVERAFKGFENTLSDKQRNKLLFLENEDDKQIKRVTISRILIDMYIKEYIRNMEEILRDLISNNIMNDRVKIYEFVKGKNSSNESISNYFYFSDKFKEEDKSFRVFLKDEIVDSEIAQGMDGKATFIVRRLFKAYLNNPQQLPNKTIITAMRRYKEINPDVEIEGNQENNQARMLLRDKMRAKDKEYICVLLRTVCDHVAGMTDQYAISQYKKLYVVE